MGKIYLDLEFIESGYKKPLEIISIGIVNEDGKEYYAVCSEFTPQNANDWVKENVLKNLEIPKEGTKSIKQIRKDIIEFVGDDPRPEFWTYFGSYDWVLFSMIFGTMMDLPKNFPMYTMDIKQLAVELGNPKLPEQTSEEHNSLNDAKHNKIMHEWLLKYKFVQKRFNLKEFKILLDKNNN